MGDRQIFDHLVDKMFERKWFSNNGELVQRLEATLAEYLGVRHCILVCNATVGLQIACHALDLSGEVILPAFTFVATAHALQWERIKPVFADVDPITHTICPSSIESKITDQTSAIVGVHLWGTPCDTEAIDQIASRYNLATMYDAAHAFGSKHNGKMVGNFGCCEVFSFHATKFFNTFEGGAITTNDDELASKIRLMKNFGFSGMDNVVHLGTNGKMPEVCAAMGLASFAALDDILAVNRTNFERYQQQLRGAKGLRLIDYTNQEATNWQYIVLEIDADEFGCTRDELLQKLHDENIRARRYFYPGCHRMEPYNTLYPIQRERLPETDRLANRVLCLPTGTSISRDDIDRVCSVITTRQ